MALDPDVLDVLREIVDPEIGINIVDLGLVYRAERMADAIDAMTMTARSCPLGEIMLEEARAALSQRFSGLLIATSLVCNDDGARARIARHVMSRRRGSHARYAACCDSDEPGAGAWLA
jgi:metal-sulfur cluster biosynthetic enzyme